MEACESVVYKNYKANLVRRVGDKLYTRLTTNYKETFRHCHCLRETCKCHYAIPNYYSAFACRLHTYRYVVLQVGYMCVYSNVYLLFLFLIYVTLSLF